MKKTIIGIGIFCLAIAVVILKNRFKLKDSQPTSEEHTDKINNIAISPDGKLLTSAGEDGTVRLWLTDRT